MNDTTLLLHSIFIVNKQVVNPEHSLDLEDIFEQIKKINQSKIVYKTMHQKSLFESTKRLLLMCFLIKISNQ